ncbi:hypothetical protein Ddc_14231 [Ditylenchus destructor]|nr:hypothetical protein Ddc_14231 [Ditylenchus destructor]
MVDNEEVSFNDRASKNSQPPQQGQNILKISANLYRGYKEMCAQKQHVPIELPSFKFSFCQGAHENAHLKFIAWRPEVISSR